MIGWRPKEKSRRIVLFVSDALPKIAGDGQVISSFYFQSVIYNLPCFGIRRKFLCLWKSMIVCCVCIVVYTIVCTSVQVTLKLVWVPVLTRKIEYTYNSTIIKSKLMTQYIHDRMNIPGEGRKKNLVNKYWIYQVCVINYIWVWIWLTRILINISMSFN